MYYDKIDLINSLQSGQYTTQQYVTLSFSYSSTSASIYYNLNNSQTYTKYTTPILLANVIEDEDDLYNLKVKLIEKDNSSHQSNIYQYDYNISILPHIIFNIANPNDSYIQLDGSYNGYAVVSIASTFSSRGGESIYYTTDGSQPTTKSQLYTQSLKYIVPGNESTTLTKQIKALIEYNSFSIIQSCSVSISPKKIRVYQYDNNQIQTYSDTNLNAGFTFIDSSTIQFAAAGSNQTNLNTFCTR